MNEHRDEAYEVIDHAEETNERGYRVNNYMELVMGAILLQLAGLRDDLCELNKNIAAQTTQVM